MSKHFETTPARNLQLIIRFKRFLFLWTVIALGAGCGSETPTSAPPTSTLAPTKTPIPPTPSVPAMPALSESDYWRASTPEEQGMDSERLADMLAYIQDRQYDIASVTIIRNGYMVLDTNFYPFNPDSSKNVGGVAKGILSALVGIAIDKGYIESVDQPVLDFFPERTVANPSPDKQAITVEHLLTNSTGLRCQDSSLYVGPGLIQMINSPDWVQFVLDLPMAEVPGTRFEYCNGAAFLLSAIIQQTTGMTALEFSEQHLFGPLGISDVIWASNAQGITIGMGELRIRPHDLAKIGYLYLNEGLWDGEQVVSSTWAEASTRKHIYAGEFQNGYGYLWWVARSGIPMVVSPGGQYLVLVPEKEMVVVFTGDLKKDTESSIPLRLLNSYIIRAAESPAPLAANPDGVAKLQALIQKVAQAP